MRGAGWGDWGHDPCSPGSSRASICAPRPRLSLRVSERHTLCKASWTT